MLLRDVLGETLRHTRVGQKRTLRDISAAANVSLGYLSEVERGRKEASSELLAAICDALDVELSDVLIDASSSLRSFEATSDAATVDATVDKFRIVLPYRPAPAERTAV